MVGRGFWEIRWHPDGSALLYRFGATCNLLEQDPRVWFRLPASLESIRAIAVRDIVRQALGSTSRWNAGNHIGAFNWFGPDRIIVNLAEEDPGKTIGRTNGVIVVVGMKTGAGMEAGQLNPFGFRSTALATAQISEDRSDDMLRVIGCRVDGIDEQDLLCITPDISKQMVRIDLQRYCSTLSAGDIEQFCTGPKTAAVSWTRFRHRDNVLLLKQYEEVPPVPAGHVDVPSQLFLMKNDAGGYLK